MPTTKRRTVLSLEAVLEAGIAELDENGVDRLSVRAVARRLDAGVASIYWYIDNKGHLVDLAVDQILAEVTAPDAIEQQTSVDPLTAVRQFALRLYAELDTHEWCAGRITQDPDRQPHSVRALDLVGRQLGRLGLTTLQQFHAATTLMTYIIGSCSQQAIALGQLNGRVSGKNHLADVSSRWEKADPEKLPFLHSAALIVREHDNQEQFEFGLDLMLEGVGNLVQA